MIRPLLLSLLLAVALTAQEPQTGSTPELSPFVTKLQSSLDNNKYDEVVDRGMDYLKSKNRDTHGDAVAAILMEAYVQTKEYSRFERVKKGFLKKYPQSPYRARVRYLSGVVLANQQDYSNALRQFDLGFLALAIKGTSSKEQALITKTYEKLAAVYVSSDELKQLKTEARSTQAKAIIERYTSEKSTENEPKATKHHNQEEPTVAPIIALLAPVTGDYSALGQSAVNTAELALEAYRNKTGQEFRLKVIDTKGSALEVARQMQQLTKDSIALVVGPIMSNTSTVAAAMLIEHPEILMITPTATDDGIAGLGPNIYQLNLTPRALSTKIANYAMKSLHITHFTILAPLSEYGDAMATHFAEAVVAGGGTVDIKVQFSTKSHDHRKQFNQVRTYFANQKFGDSDTLDKITPQMIKERAQYMEDSTIALGGIFIPATAENVITIAAEIPFHHLQGQLLGVNSWSTKKILTKGGSGVQNSFFSTQEKVDQKGAKWQSFSKTYEERYNSKPHKMVAPLVFDAFQILLSSYSSNGSINQIISSINSTSEYSGLSGTITLDSTAGVNSHAKIMKVSGDKFIRIQ